MQSYCLTDKQSTDLELIYWQQMFLTVITTTTPTPATTHWARTGLRCRTSPTTTTAPSRWPDKTRYTNRQTIQQEQPVNSLSGSASQNTNNQLFCSVKNMERERRGLFGLESNATLPADWKHHEPRKDSGPSHWDVLLIHLLKTILQLQAREMKRVD